MPLCYAGPGKLSEERPLRSAGGVDVNRDRRGQGCRRLLLRPAARQEREGDRPLRGGLSGRH